MIGRRGVAVRTELVETPIRASTSSRKPCRRIYRPSNTARNTAQMLGLGTAGVLHPSSGPSWRRNSGADCQPATRMGLSPNSCAGQWSVWSGGEYTSGRRLGRGGSSPRGRRGRPVGLVVLMLSVSEELDQRQETSQSNHHGANLDRNALFEH